MTMQTAPLDHDPSRWSLNVLVLDDHDDAVEIAELLSGAGHSVQTTPHPGEAVAAARGCDIVIAATGSGALVARVRASRPELHVIWLSDEPRTDEAIAATRDGADYLARRPGYRNLLGPIGAVAREREARARARIIKPGPEGVLVGASPLIKSLRAELAQIARGDRLAVIAGEPGAGKTTAARALHASLDPGDGEFVEIDGADAEPGSLRAAIAAAARGTLAIARSERLSPTAARALAAAIDAADAPAIIALTDDPSAETPIDALAAAPGLEVPPLRSRRDDIPALTRHAINRRWRSAAEPPSPTAAAWSALAQRRYRRNVAELDELIGAALDRCDGGRIRAADLGEKSLERRPPRTSLLARAAERLRPSAAWVAADPALEIGWGR
jgi:two-component system nitrogen regulation response regulator GlnG